MTIDNAPTTIADSLALSTASEMTMLRQALGQPGLMGDSIAAMVSHLSPYLAQPSDIPGHGEAGSYDHDFGTIHNHGLWSVAAVGICGLVIGNDNYVTLAVDGLKGDRSSGGYLAEIAQLFAPSGYYIEGPYYHRFACDFDWYMAVNLDR